MSAKTRLIFKQIINESKAGSRICGGHLSLNRLGAGSWKGKIDTPEPAVIKFYSGYLQEARNISEPEYKEFASMKGQFLLKGTAMTPTFICDPQAQIEYSEAEPGDETPFRELSLVYDAADFQNAPGSDSPASKLRLPLLDEEAEARSRFFELGVELEIANAVASSKEQNARLDLPLHELEKLTSTVPLEQMCGVAKLMNRERFLTWMTSIFGHDIPHSAFEAFRNALLRDYVRMPSIKVLSELPEGKQAGYDSDQKAILFQRAFVKEALDDEDAAATFFAALIEEFGHHVDDLLRNKYSKTGGDKIGEFGDEGAQFGYSLSNLKWDLSDTAIIAHYMLDPQIHEITITWPQYKKAIEELLGPEEQRKDDMQGAIEFFGAGKGHGKPGQSFGHESIEDVLKPVFNKQEREQIYFGNWMRDYSQAITPISTLVFSRKALTEVFDIYARAKFADKPEYRVTETRFGVYRAEEHIDNPTGLKNAAPVFNQAPTKHATSIDPVQQRARYIADRLPGSDISGAQYMEAELAAALNASDLVEGRRRLGQALHTLEDFYAHSNFCELALRSVGKTSVEPWTSSVSAAGKTFFPLVTGNFGGLDTAASIFLALGEIMEADLDSLCEAGKRPVGVKIMLVLLKDYKPHIAKQFEAMLVELEEIKKAHPKIATLGCRTIGTFGKVINYAFGVIIRLLANQIDEYQTLTANTATINPSHTQLAKDHDDHPLHLLAADCAKIAVADIGQQVKEIWDGKNSLPKFEAITAVQKAASAYFVHPDLIVKPPVGSAKLNEIISTVEAFAKSPVNAGKISQASKRSQLEEHLDKAKEYADRATESIPIERLKQIFGIE